MSADVTVVGAERLEATMRGAARDIEDMEAPMNSVAAKIARDASGRAPRLTGALADSIRPSYHGGNVATVGSDVPYAGVVEYGWPKRNRRADPYLHPALAENSREALEETQQRAQGALNHVKGA